MAWAKGYGLELNPSAQRPNPKPKELRANEKGRNNNNNNGGASSKKSDAKSSSSSSAVSNPSVLNAFEQPQIGSAGSWSAEAVESAVNQDATASAIGSVGSSSSTTSSSRGNRMSGKSSSSGSSSSGSSSTGGGSSDKQGASTHASWSDDLEAKERLQWGPDRTHAFG